MAAAGPQPFSSPRLPSPPPLTEVQIGSKSPSVGDSSAEQSLGYHRGDDNDDVGATRRVRPGTKADEMAGGPPLVPLAQLDSPFQLQEHLKALHNHYTRPEDSDTVIPVHRDIAIQLAEPPEGVDRALWLYELCRFLTVKVNNLIVAFFAETPPCSAQTCPEMQASEWQYLCAVHDPPKTCCAIDYCCHTLDWATNILTSPKYFPSRLTLGSEASGGPQTSMRHLVNIFRRLYRIFAHAWFKHREVFWQVEGNDGLYIFFKTVCDVYHLMPEDSYTVPPEAEGIEPRPPPPAKEPADVRRVTIMKKEDEGSSLHPSSEDANDAGATTRRHKQSPSTDLRATTIAESAEDSEESSVVGVKDAAAEKVQEPKETAPSEESEKAEPTEQPSQDDTVDGMDTTEAAESKPEETTKETRQSRSTGQTELNEPEETKAEADPSKPEDAGETVSEPSVETSEPTTDPEPTAEPEEKPEEKAEAEQKPSEPTNEAKDGTEPAKES